MMADLPINANVSSCTSHQLAASRGAEAAAVGALWNVKWRKTYLTLQFRFMHLLLQTLVTLSLHSLNLTLQIACRLLAVLFPRLDSSRSFSRISTPRGPFSASRLLAVLFPLNNPPWPSMHFPQETRSARALCELVFHTFPQLAKTWPRIRLFDSDLDSDSDRGTDSLILWL